MTCTLPRNTLKNRIIQAQFEHTEIKGTGYNSFFKQLIRAIEVHYNLIKIDLHQIKWRLGIEETLLAKNALPELSTFWQEYMKILFCKEDVFWRNPVKTKVTYGPTWGSGRTTSAGGSLPQNVSDGCSVLQCSVAFNTSKQFSHCNIPCQSLKMNLDTQYTIWDIQYERVLKYHMSFTFSWSCCRSNCPFNALEVGNLTLSVRHS